MASPHRRKNPLSDEWVLCSPGRLNRPWLGEREELPKAAASPYDPGCYLCPGNARGENVRNPDYRGVFLFDNDYPALTPGWDRTERGGEDPHPLFVTVPARGRCRVLSFSEKHDRHLGSMSLTEVRAVVEAWASESLRLKREDNARYVQIFENRGTMMGASNPHPHGQIWAVEHLPAIPGRKAEKLRGYWEQKNRDLLGDYSEEEIRRYERVVETSEHWLQVVPFWAVWPFETLLIPHRLVGSLEELNDRERTDLALLMGNVVRRYDDLFGTPFPYSMGWYEKPNDGRSHEGFRLHAAYLPPLLRSATVRKFTVGYELTSEPQRDFTPEEAAERLRAVVS
ncbi:MAG: UDP-glucose--hexose-1-phosphate uridylyltransferase [Vicinamibacteria bacterium]